jgi:hypothetical protein
VTFDRGRHGYGHGGPGHFFSCEAPGIPLTHRPNGWDAADPIAEPAVWCPTDRGPIPGQDPTWYRPPAGDTGRERDAGADWPLR